MDNDIKISPSTIVSLIDIHDMTLDQAIDEGVKMVKESLKVACKFILDNRTYPVKYKLGDMTLIIHKDGKKALDSNKEGDWSHE